MLRLTCLHIDRPAGRIDNPLASLVEGRLAGSVEADVTDENTCMANQYATSMRSIPRPMRKQTSQSGRLASISGIAGGAEYPAGLCSTGAAEGLGLRGVQPVLQDLAETSLGQVGYLSRSGCRILRRAISGVFWRSSTQAVTSSVLAVRPADTLIFSTDPPYFDNIQLR